MNRKRRDFLKGTIFLGLGVAHLVVTGCTPEGDAIVKPGVSTKKQPPGEECAGGQRVKNQIIYEERNVAPGIDYRLKIKGQRTITRFQIETVEGRQITQDGGYHYDGRPAVDQWNDLVSDPEVTTTEYSLGSTGIENKDPTPVEGRYPRDAEICASSMGEIFIRPAGSAERR